MSKNVDEDSGMPLTATEVDKLLRDVAAVVREETRAMRDRIEDIERKVQGNPLNSESGQRRWRRLCADAFGIPVGPQRPDFTVKLDRPVRLLPRKK